MFPFIKTFKDQFNKVNSEISTLHSSARHIRADYNDQNSKIRVLEYKIQELEKINKLLLDKLDVKVVHWEARTVLLNNTSHEHCGCDLSK